MKPLHPDDDQEPGRCARHFSHPAILSCIDCGAGMCRQCIYRGVDGFARCPDCARPTDILDDQPDPADPVLAMKSDVHETASETSHLEQDEHRPLSVEGIPWENRKGSDIVAFFATVVQATTRPRTFTQKINFSYTRYREVFTFGIIMGTLAQLVATLNVIGNPDEFSRMVDVMGLPNTTPVSSFVFMTLPFLPLAAGLVLVLKAGLAHLMARIVLKVDQGFGPTLKIVAYAEASSILFLIPFIGPYAYKFLFVFLMLMGIRTAYGSTVGQAVLILLPTLFLSM